MFFRGYNSSDFDFSDVLFRPLPVYPLYPVIVALTVSPQGPGSRPASASGACSGRSSQRHCRSIQEGKAWPNPAPKTSNPFRSGDRNLSLGSELLSAAVETFDSWENLSTGKKPLTPRKKPSTLGKKPSTPEKKPSTPEKKPSIPRKKPSIPRKKPSTPGKKPSTPEKKPLTPRKKPSIPRKKPSIPGKIRSILSIRPRFGTS